MIITEFGRPVRPIERPGLHFKWPYQRRAIVRPPAPARYSAGARDAHQGQEKPRGRLVCRPGGSPTSTRSSAPVRTLADATARLEDMAASVLAAELGGHELGALVTVSDRSALGAMMSSVKERIGEQALREYGLEVVDVRLARLNYPEEVRSAVFEQIKSERQRVAAATRAEGQSQARVIKSAADRERSALIARAEADAARLIGEGEAQAARIANEAHAADPAFYQFQKTLETYRAALDAKTTLVLSADSSFLRLLSQGVPDPAAKGPAR